jgi:hypothetical protein
MRSRRLACLSVLVALTACSDRDRSQKELALEEAPWLIAEVLLEREASLEPDSYALFLPIDLVLRGDTLAVLDSGNRRVVFFDRALNPISAFGREGKGPGEFEAPTALSYAAGAYQVLDPANQRLSTFRADGTLLGSREILVHPIARSFVTDRDGTVYATGQDPAHHLSAFRSDGSVEPIFSRIDSLFGMFARVGGSSDLVARSGGDTLHLFDAAVGRLHKVDRSGTVHATRALPGAMMRRIREQARKSSAVLGPLTAVAIGQHLSVTNDEHLLLLVSDHEQTAAVVIDPVTYRSRSIHVPSGHRLLSGSGAAALSGDSLFVLFHDAIRVYRVRK